LSWLRISVGRQSFAKFFTANEFLGDFLTAGIHRMDAVTVTIPLLFSTEVDDRGSYKSPPTAITYGYVPKLISAEQTGVPSDLANAGYQFGQLRVSFPFEKWAMDNTLKLNFGKANNEIIDDSPLGPSASYDGSYELIFKKDYSLFFEYGLQDSTVASTSAMVLGLHLSNLHESLYLIDELVGEYLIAGSQDPYNVLTGGNPQAYGQANNLPSNEWYVRVSNRIGKWELGGAATTSEGNYTFGRIQQGSLSVPLDGPVGPVNEIDGHAVALLANSTIPIAFYIYSMYHF